jgi:two-component system response regulator RegA
MPDSRKLLLVEDDASFAKALKRSFERRSYEVRICQAVNELAPMLESFSPEYAVVDLKLAAGSGLECVKTLHARDPKMKIVVLTGFASIATAVEAIKLGACHYLAKPSNTDDIEAAFRRAEGDASVALTAKSTSIKNIEWECTGARWRGSSRIITSSDRRAARPLGRYRVTPSRLVSDGYCLTNSPSC